MPDELLLFWRLETGCTVFAVCGRPSLTKPSESGSRMLRAGAPILIGEGRCAICQQATTVVAYIPGDPDLSRLDGD